MTFILLDIYQRWFSVLRGSISTLNNGIKELLHSELLFLGDEGVV